MNKQFHYLKSLPLLFAAAMIIFTTGCSSVLKKQCESTNWFEYGTELAHQGRRASGDDFILRCEKEEATVDHGSLSRGFQKGQDEYCTSDYAYLVGRRGDFLVLDMCAGGMEKTLKARHVEGVRDYCLPGNGVQAGFAGRKYNQICPKTLESAFLPEFNKGRRKYLVGVVDAKTSEQQIIEREVADYGRRAESARWDVAQKRANRDRLQQGLRALKVGDVSYQSMQQALSTAERELNSALWEQQNIEKEISTKRAKQRELGKEIAELRAEISTLE